MAQVIKSIEVRPNSEHHRIVNAIMRRVQLKETSRTVVGGHMSDVGIVITFQGGDDHLRLFKDEYIEVHIKNSCNNTSTFYSIDALEGFMGTTEQFKAHVLKVRNGESEYEFKRLDFTNVTDISA
jgi:hypothetical protein